MKKPLQIFLVVISLNSTWPALLWAQNGRSEIGDRRLEAAASELALTSTQASATPLAVTISVVTAAHYCDFLNAVATIDDLYHLYDEAMESDPATACIVRLGTPEQWHYEVIEGRENVPICYLDENDQKKYCDWFNNGKGELINDTENRDDSLKSSSSDFEINIPSSPTLTLAATPIFQSLSSLSNSNSYWTDAAVAVFAVACMMTPGGEAINAADVAQADLPHPVTIPRSLTLEDFSQAAKDHPTASRFVMKEENGITSIVPQEANSAAAGKNRSENITIARALRVALSQKHSEVMVENLFPLKAEGTGIIVNYPALSATKLHEIVVRSRLAMILSQSGLNKTSALVNNSSVTAIKTQIADIEATLAQTDCEIKRVALEAAEKEVKRLTQAEAARVESFDAQKIKDKEAHQLALTHLATDKKIEGRKNNVFAAYERALKASHAGNIAASGPIIEAQAENATSQGLNSIDRKILEEERKEQFKKSQEAAALQNSNAAAAAKVAIDKAQQALDLAQAEFDKAKIAEEEAKKTAKEVETRASSDNLSGEDSDLENLIMLNREELIEAITKIHEIVSFEKDAMTTKAIKEAVGKAEEAKNHAAEAQEATKEAKQEAFIALEKANTALTKLAELQKRVDAGDPAAAEEIKNAFSLAKQAAVDAEVAEKNAQEAITTAKAALEELQKALATIKELETRITELEAAIKEAVDAKKDAEDAQANSNALSSAQLQAALDAQAKAEQHIADLQASMKKWADDAKDAADKAKAEAKENIEASQAKAEDAAKTAQDAEKNVAVIKDHFDKHQVASNKALAELKEDFDQKIAADAKNFEQRLVEMEKAIKAAEAAKTTAEIRADNLAARLDSMESAFKQWATDIKNDVEVHKAQTKAAAAQAVADAKADFDQKSAADAKIVESRFAAMESQIKAADHAKAIAENRVATLESDLLKTGAIAAGSKADLEAYKAEAKAALDKVIADAKITADQAIDSIKLLETTLEASFESVEDRVSVIEAEMKDVAAAKVAADAKKAADNAKIIVDAQVAEAEVAWNDAMQKSEVAQQAWQEANNASGIHWSIWEKNTTKIQSDYQQAINLSRYAQASWSLAKAKIALLAQGVQEVLRTRSARPIEITKAEVNEALWAYKINKAEEIIHLASICPQNWSRYEPGDGHGHHWQVRAPSAFNLACSAFYQIQSAEAKVVGTAEKDEESDLWMKAAMNAQIASEYRTKAEQFYSARDNANIYRWDEAASAAAYVHDYLKRALEARAMGIALKNEEDNLWMQAAEREKILSDYWAQVAQAYTTQGSNIPQREQAQKAKNLAHEACHAVDRMKHSLHRHLIQEAKREQILYDDYMGKAKEEWGRSWH
ncbi:MAG: hypothetical protein ACH346_04845 [Chthoniobacterales bacterium]